MSIGRSTYKVSEIDWVTVALWLGLVLMGWLAIYAADYESEWSNIFSTEKNYGKQFIWMCVSLVVAICLMVIDSRFYTTFTYIIYGIILCSLVVVLFVGVKVAGSTSWLQIGGFRFQPAEFAKFATTLALAKYLSTLNVTIKTPKAKLISFALMLAEELSSSPSLIPQELDQRAAVLKLADDICGKNGLGWWRRLQLIHYSKLGSGHAN